MIDTETQRTSAFAAIPVLRGFLACALQDAQYTESDEACEQERDEYDTGTIYDCSESVFEWARDYCARFMAECAIDIAAALETGHSARIAGTHEAIGATLYLTCVGHGVSFTDDSTAHHAPHLERLEQWASDNRQESPYFGDDGALYA